MAEEKTKTTKQKLEKVEIERIYIIPLRKEINKAARYKKTNRAIKSIKQFLAKHMKVYDRDLKKIKIDKYLNEFMWARGIKNPPHKIKIKATKDSNGIVKVELIDYSEKLKFKKLREERIEKSAREISEKKKEVEEAKPEEVEKPKDEEKEKEEKEKKAAVVEAGKELEKTSARQMKHQAEAKSKQPKHQFRKALEK